MPEILKWLIALLVIVAAAVLLNRFVIINSVVPSGSMIPTIQNGDRLIGLRVNYLFSDPERGDIVVFHYPDDPSELYIKRIIGLPGEVLEIVDGQTYINDERIEEDYINPEYWITEEVLNEDFGPYEIPEGSYFMMGDNRGNSHDSRYWDHTFVERKEMIGKAYFRYWPVSQIGKIK